MSITEGTQPAVVTWTGAWTSAQTTASFTPESGALLVAIVSGDGSQSALTTASITDSLSGSWTLLKRQNVNDPSIGGTTEVWCRDSPGTALTVSVTGSGSPTNGGQLAVRTLIGAKAAASQNGATAGASFASAAAVQVSVAAGTGNKVYGAAFNWTNSTNMTALGNTSVINAFSDTTNGSSWEAYKSSGDTAGTATYGYSTSTQGLIAAAEILAAPPAASVFPARPGQAWLRHFHHRQFLPPPSAAAAAAAGPQVFQLQPPRNTRQPARGHLGRLGACAAGILAVTTLSPQPSSVPPSRPQPVIQHLASHRAIWQRTAGPAQPSHLTAPLPPSAISPRPAHRATGKGILAKTTLSPQPTVVNVLPQPVPIRRPGPHRAQWQRIAAPPPAVVTVTAVPPSRPQPVTNRPPPPHRATGHGILATTTLPPQPSRVPPPAWRQPNAPRPAHRAVWRAIAGPAPAVAAPAAAAPSRPAPVTNRPPAPHRAVARWVLAKTTLSAQPSRVNGPQWRQPNAPRPAHRAIWRAVAGIAPPPPPFTIGTLTAADKGTSALTAAGTASALTALTAPAGGTLTATDQRTGGPG